MDLSDLTPKNDTVVTYLKTPITPDPVKGSDGEYYIPEAPALEHDSVEMWIERYLPHTPEYKKAQYKRTQKYLKAAQKAGNKDVDIDLFEAENDRIEVFAETTVAWEIYYGGEWVELTPEKAGEVYTKLSFVMDQLQEDENSAEVFTKV